MKLSLAAELGVRGVIVLAEKYGQGPITLDTICARRDLPKQYLVKIFASLARAGLIIPIRGKHGGYVLGRDPDAITLLQVIEAVEGPLTLNLCQQDPPQCDEVSCPIRPLWAELRRIVRGKLASMTLAECVNHEAAVPSAQPGVSAK